MSSRPSAQRPRVMYAGLALTAAATLVPLIDMVTVDSLTGHVRDAYPNWPSSLVAGDRNAIVIYLCIVGALGIAGWIWSIWTVTRRKRTMRPVTMSMFILGVCVALFDLTFSGGQYTRVIPLLYGVVGLLPSLAGLRAVIRVWRLESPSDTNVSARGHA